MEEFILDNATQLTPAWIALSVFLFAYLLVILEEFTQLRKSKPLVVASGIIWMMVAIIAKQHNQQALIQTALQHHLIAYLELLLFLVVAITYINVLTERQVFESLRGWLIKRGYSYRQLFWITGILTFVMSAFADNLTTALAMSAVIFAIGKDNPRFVGLSCINIVVAANAGGAFSPFGDITTLMVWQADILPFARFFKLFFPSLVNFLIPAFCMYYALPKATPSSTITAIPLSAGGKRIIFLFSLTIITTICLKHFFQLPPAIGMMVGLGYLQFFAYYTKYKSNIKTIEIFPAIKELDWDTLLFFYGIILSVGGLATLGYLKVFSNALYTSWPTTLSASYQYTPGNILIGILSAIVDNIPLMFSVITLHPIMSEGQWLLLTLTAGVGGSLLSIGSAAGIAVMGQGGGLYTFFTHLKWFWAIALGYIASIICHLWWNARLF